MATKSAKERIEICKVCPYAKKTLGMLRCGLCGCVMVIKTRVLKAKCPAGKW